jgi:N-acetylglucosamine kinase-like BadF-type ATPase
VILVLGVDGGGTSTHALVADERGTVRGFGFSGPSNWEDIGFDAAIASVVVAAREAMEAAGTAPESIEAAVYGLAGIDFASDESRMSGVQPTLGVNGPFQVLNDSFVAMRAGTNHPWGIVVVAGTGSVVAGRNPAGESFRTIGLGPLYGDDASATEVSQAAVTAVAAQMMGTGPRTTLTEKMCVAAGVPDPMALIEAISKLQIPDDGFTPIVFEAAEGGDLVARRILEGAGASLGDRAGHVARRLSMGDSEFELVLAGRLFRTESRILRAALEATVKRSARFVYPVTLEAPPVVGAALLALELRGLAVDQDTHARLAVAAIESLNRRRIA